MTAHPLPSGILITPPQPTRRAWRRRAALAALAVAALVPAVAPVAANAVPAAVAIAPAAETYVGAVSGTDAFIALVRTDGDVRGYVCDGVAVSAWFSSSLRGTQLSATTEGLSISAKRSGRTFTGTVRTADGVAHKFTATRTTASGTAGLYRGEVTANGSTYVGGWIVLPGNKVRGYVEQDNLRGATFTPTGSSALVTILAGRRSVEIPGVGPLQITDGTSNVR